MERSYSAPFTVRVSAAQASDAENKVDEFRRAAGCRVTAVKLVENKLKQTLDRSMYCTSRYLVTYMDCSGHFGEVMIFRQSAYGARYAMESLIGTSGTQVITVRNMGNKDCPIEHYLPLGVISKSAGGVTEVIKDALLGYLALADAETAKHFAAFVRHIPLGEAVSVLITELQAFCAPYTYVVQLPDQLVVAVCDKELTDALDNYDLVEPDSATEVDELAIGEYYLIRTSAAETLFRKEDGRPFRVWER